MSQIQIRRPKSKTAAAELDLRTPSGRHLPY